MAARATALLRDRFAASDPGLLRLIAALRAVLGVALTLAVLAALRQPVMILLTGGFAAMVTSLAISDIRPREQFITLLTGVVPSIAALLAGELLAPHPIAVRVVFLLLIFGAVYARRFGPRGLRLGIFAFMMFFLSQFTKAQPAQLPQMCGAVAVAFAASALTRFGLVPATTAGTLRRLRRTFDRRLRHVLRDTIEVLAGGHGDARWMRSLERHVERLHASALMIEDFLDEDLMDGSTVDLVRRRVVRAEVAAERLAVLAIRAVRTTPPPGARAEESAREHLIGELWALEHDVARRPATDAGPRLRERSRGYRAAEEPPSAPMELQDVYRGLGELAGAVFGDRPVADGLVTRDAGAPHGGRPRAALMAERARMTVRRSTGDDAGPGGLDRPTTRQSFQVTAAAALAVAGGGVLSSRLWYWAVVTAWVVFINMESTGEVLLQGSRRLIGTIAGAVFGYALSRSSST